MENKQKQIITSIPSRDDFFKILQHNKGLIILKIGATWCNPCKKIEPYLNDFYSTMPENVLCCDIDVDECFDLYAFLKTKKMTNGIPTILCYFKGNTTFVPDDSVTGSDINQLQQFFNRCKNKLLNI